MNITSFAFTDCRRSAEGCSEHRPKIQNPCFQTTKNRQRRPRLRMGTLPICLPKTRYNKYTRHRSCAYSPPPCVTGRVSPQPLSVFAQPSQLALFVLFGPIELLPATRNLSDSAALDQFPFREVSLPPALKAICFQPKQVGGGGIGYLRTNPRRAFRAADESIPVS